MVIAVLRFWQILELFENAHSLSNAAISVDIA
jgi:hypothetical protein